MIMCRLRQTRDKGLFGKVAKGVLLLGLFLSVLALTQSATLHKAFHPTAGQSDHQCAVTLLAAGHVDASPSAVTVSATPLVPIFLNYFEATRPACPSFNLSLSRGPPALLS